MHRVCSDFRALLDAQEAPARGSSSVVSPAPCNPSVLHPRLPEHSQHPRCHPPPAPSQIPAVVIRTQEPLARPHPAPLVHSQASSVFPTLLIPLDPATPCSHSCLPRHVPNGAAPSRGGKSKHHSALWLCYCSSHRCQPWSSRNFGRVWMAPTECPGSIDGPAVM